MTKRNRTVSLPRRRHGAPKIGESVAPKECRIQAVRPRAGETPIVDAGRTYGGCDPRLGFSVVRLSPRRPWREKTTRETLWVLLSGSITATVGERVFAGHRASLFDEGATSLHCGPGRDVTILAGADGAELAVVRTDASRFDDVLWSTAIDGATENRGAGLVQGACQRQVRTIFDYATRPESGLVAGEVVNLPGRWSSYPPHHHPQPEIYHYRFTQPQGYGHAELGDDVLKVRHGDTVVIPGGLDHAQVSAPGYGMYYLWIVRHLPRHPYRGFTFTPAHTWLLDPKQQGWIPATTKP